MPDLVSILIPAFNAERWIAATLRSALAQDWPRIEVIVVDDGSTDRTLEVARTFAGPTCRVVTQSNAGASAARNKAYSLAQGHYIQWLDADDLLAPDKLSAQLRGSEPGSRSKILLSSAFAEFYGDPSRGEFVAGPLWKDSAPVDHLIARFTQNSWMCPAAWLVSRRLAELAGGWDERLSLDDDGEYFARVVGACDGIRFVPDARSYYRRGNIGSLSRAVSARACESLLLSLELCIGHLRRLEDSDRTREASLRLLQNWVDLSDCFMPDAPCRFDRLEDLGRQLGGKIQPHRLPWKYVPIRAALGWSGVKRVRRTVSNVKTMLRSMAGEMHARQREHHAG